MYLTKYMQRKAKVAREFEEQQASAASLLVDAMLPDLLLGARAVGAGTEDGLHLGDAREQGLAGDEPADAFMAGGAGEAALVGPELVEVQDAVEGEAEVQGGLLLSARLVEADHGGQLGEELVVGVAGVEAEGEDGDLMTLGVDVDKVHLRLGAVAADGVVGRGVDVPADHVDRLVVVGERGVARVDALGVGDGEGRAVAPVEEVARHVGRVVEDGAVVEGQTVTEAQGDGRLLGAGLAEGVVWMAVSMCDLGWVR